MSVVNANNIGTSFLHEGAPTGQYKDDQSLWFGTYTNEEKRDVLTFETPSSLGTIISAKLYLYQDFGGTNASGLTADLHPIIRSDFDYATCTWNVYKTGSNWGTAGGGGASDIGSKITGIPVNTTTGVWNSFDVTVDWSTTYHYLIKLSSSVDGNYFHWYSKANTDSAHRPYLEITYSSSSLKTVIGLASPKTIMGLALASVKTAFGLA